MAGLDSGVNETQEQIYALGRVGNRDSGEETILTTIRLIRLGGPEQVFEDGGCEGEDCLMDAEGVVWSGAKDHVTVFCGERIWEHERLSVWVNLEAWGGDELGFTLSLGYGWWFRLTLGGSRGPAQLQRGS